MTLQHVSQMNDRFAQRLTAGLLVIQAAIATTAISTFATQPVFAQDAQPKAQAAQLFASEQMGETKQMSVAAKALSPQAVCWTNATAQNCSYTISPTHPLSLELPKPNQLNTATVIVPATAATCWTSTTAQDCSYTISLSPADRLNPYPLQQISGLPSFDAPLGRLILVRAQF